MKKLLLTLTVVVSAFTISSAQDWLLYGTTSGGGSHGYGTLFTHDLTTGKDSVVLNFDSLDGRYPQGNVALDPVNELVYGMTRYGGAGDNGVLFSYDPFTHKDSTQVMLNITYGANPILGGPVYYNNMFYGMTFDGGASGYGVLYAFNPVNGKDSILVDFQGGLGHEMYPYGTTVTPYKGMIYGMTNYGADANNDGSIFRYDPATGKDSLVVVFDTLNGEEPGEGGLTLDPKNNLLYGMTLYGGKNLWGDIISYDPITGKDSEYVAFDSAHGRFPYGNLTYDSTNGMFYGMTGNGGPKDFGVLFRFNPVTGKDTVLVYFDSTHGSYPYGNLTFDTSGMMYGLTLGGGPSNDGVMFRFNPVTNKDTVLLNFTGPNGASPTGSLTLVHQQLPLSVNQQANTIKQVGIYPNPFNSNATITFSEGGTHYLELYDVAGRMLNNIECSGRQYELNRNGLATGVYFIKAFDATKSFISTAKIVVE